MKREVMIEYTLSNAERRLKNMLKNLAQSLEELDRQYKETRLLTCMLIGYAEGYLTSKQVII